MPDRILAIALNTYREAVRARVLLGLFSLGLATCLYALIVASLSLHNELRVVADLGSASISLYGVVIAIVLGSTSLYRELEHKTIFPILSRPIRRWEYLVGKYLGTMLTVAVFVALDSAAILAMLGLEAGLETWKLGVLAAGAIALLGLMLARTPYGKVFTVVPWAMCVFAGAWFLASPAMEERQLVGASCVLSLCEVGIVAAVATLFSSFSSPFLTATFTSMLFIVGRSADTLAHLPSKMFGAAGGLIAAGGRGFAHLVPNLHLYVPARPLLLGQVAGQPVWAYVASAAAHAAFYATAVLVVAALAFRKRDFS
jgi:ABC-type transport system involved in multi-copper enzyme maturation permease subunit